MRRFENFDNLNQLPRSDSPTQPLRHSTSDKRLNSYMRNYRTVSPDSSQRQPRPEEQQPHPVNRLHEIHSTYQQALNRRDGASAEHPGPEYRQMGHPGPEYGQMRHPGQREHPGPEYGKSSPQLVSEFLQQNPQQLQQILELQQQQPMRQSGPQIFSEQQLEQPEKEKTYEQMSINHQACVPKTVHTIRVAHVKQLQDRREGSEPGIHFSHDAGFEIHVSPEVLNLNRRNYKYDFQISNKMNKLVPVSTPSAPGALISIIADIVVKGKKRNYSGEWNIRHIT